MHLSSGSMEGHCSWQVVKEVFYCDWELEYLVFSTSFLWYTRAIRNATTALRFLKCRMRAERGQGIHSISKMVRYTFA